MIKKIGYSLIYCLFFVVFSQMGAKTLFAMENINEKEQILVKFKDKTYFKEIKVPFGIDKNNFLKKYQQRDDVVSAELPSIYKISVIPNDTHYQKQWYLRKIKAPQAWDLVNSNYDIIIAIIDSGVQLRHPDLHENIWINKDEIPNNNIDDDNNGFIDDYNGWDFVNNTEDPSPKFQENATETGLMHGTVVAGIAAGVGNNKTGISGISWDSKIMPLKALDDSGEGHVMDVVRAIDYAIKNGADVINFSFVGFDYSQSLYDAVKRAHKAGIVMVAAAGNEQEHGQGYNLSEVPMYPACYDGENKENMVIGVAATDVVDQKAPFSSYGHSCVDITAPGVSFYSTVVFNPTVMIGGKPLDRYFGGFWSGTSMATPVISGSVALIEKIDSSIKMKEVKEILFSSADNISRLNPNYLGQLGRGRVNLFNAVTLADKMLNNKKSEILITPFSNRESKIKKLTKNGILINEFEVFNKSFNGGVNIASGDIDGDGENEIIVSASFGGGPHIRIFSSKGELIKQFFAYAPEFRGGVNIACGDVNGDGLDEIIAGAGNTGGPHVRIFNGNGEVLGQFFAYNKNFRGGVSVAVGDIDGDRVAEIITGAGVGGGPQVRIFRASGRVVNQFFVYDKNFRGGVKVAIADVYKKESKKKNEIVVAPGAGGGPHIRIFNADGNLINQFFAYNKNFRGGVNISSADIDGDGLDEIITGAGAGGGPHVKMFKQDGKLINSFYAFEEDFIGGVNVGVLFSKK